MGISTIQSYRGAQIFEAVGLKQDVIDKYFTWTPSRIDGVGIDVIAAGSAGAPPATPSPTAGQRPHARCRAASTSGATTASTTCSTRETIHKLQHACRTGNYKVVQGVLDARQRPGRSGSAPCAACSISSGRAADPDRGGRVGRGIMKRFKTGAMTYGSISKEAHETLAIAMNRIGGKSNTGEGGEDPARYLPDANGDSQEQRHQAGGLRPLRRHQPLPGQRPGTADQDGPGRQARRRRPVARHEGVSRGSPRCATPRRAWA